MPYQSLCLQVDLHLSTYPDPPQDPAMFVLRKISTYLERVLALDFEHRAN